MAILPALILAAVSLARGAIPVADPGDYADLVADASDNAIVADYMTDQGGPVVLIYDITGPHYYNDTDAVIDHQTVSVDKNDTSVVVATDNTYLNVSYSTIVKEGYSTWLNQASFFGVNAAVHVSNKSTAYISNSNITVHNGAANIFAYGSHTTVYVDDVDLYSSGPVSHAIYASGNGTVHANNVRNYAGGNRCSAFSGDAPAGYIHVNNGVVHTTGIGSAIFYTLGESHGNNVVGKAENAPCVFSDSAQHSYFKNVDFTCGLLAGTVLFSSSVRAQGASLSFENSRLTTTGEDMPALWFGNVGATAEIISTEINTASGILVIANNSQVTQAFNYFAGYEENSIIQPAEVSITVSESSLEGDIVAYNTSSISWNLTDYSEWTGVALRGETSGTANVTVAIDSSSTWTLTEDVHLQAFSNSDKTLANIKDNGHSIYYNPSHAKNSWLKKKTKDLPDGGKLRPSS